MNISKQIFSAGVVLFLTACVPGVIEAQFLSVELDVVPEISVNVQRNLDFGEILPGQGWSEIDRTGYNSGIFRIKALARQELFITFQVPDHLEHEDPEISDRIPLRLEFAYNQGAQPSAIEAETITGPSQRIVLGDGAETNSEKDINWKYAYIYVYGSINVNNISPGAYEGELLLTVEY